MISDERKLWMASYQASNPEKFNKDFIFGKGSEEDMTEILSHVCKALESTGHIKFLGCTVEEDESKFADIHKIEESRLVEATMRFELFCKEDGSETVIHEEVSIKLLLPRIIDNFFYLISGNRYYAIYQMIDKGTYTVSNGIGLKTMLMPFIIRKNSISIEDSEETEYTGRVMELDVFKRKVNILLYYISEIGLTQTIEFFGADSDVKVVPTDAEVPSDWVIFNCGKLCKIIVSADFMKADKWFVFTLVSVIAKLRPSSIESLYDPGYWNSQLGKIYTTNKDQAINKAEKIHASVRRILDGCTQSNMVHILDKDKKSIYHLLRWILWFYDDLLKEDNMDLANKRLRLNEYILNPFIKKMSTETYRCLNSRKVTMKILKSMFSNIKPNMCIKQLITLELLRFVNSVNGIDLFGAGLKITQAGPQGLSSSDTVPIRYRGIHESYIGKIALAAASAGDPGITATLTPFVKLDGLFFDKSVKFVTPDRLPENLVILS